MVLTDTKKIFYDLKNNFHDFKKIISKHKLVLKGYLKILTSTAGKYFIRKNKSEP